MYYRSITDYCIYTSPIAWKSKKQSAISRSSAEAKLRALATTTAEIIWLRWLLACDNSTPLLCDNMSAVQIANNPIKHELTKHIGVDAPFIRSHCQQFTINVNYVSSSGRLFHQGSNKGGTSSFLSSQTQCVRFLIRVQFEFERGCQLYIHILYLYLAHKDHAQVPIVYICISQDSRM
jgi:hypothetical protein